VEVKVHTVELDPKLVARLERLDPAPEQDLDDYLQRVVNDAMRNYLRQLEAQKLGEEQKAFALQHPQLVKQYLGKYVAFHQGQFIDVDDDQYTLYVRVHQRYPEAAIGIFPVTETGEMPVYRSTTTRIPRKGSPD
jgi:hypothetical protein